MQSIQELLKKHIEKSGYTIYSISYCSKINRTTLTKILSGQRKLSQDILDKLLPFLQLTPNDLQEIQQSFHIYQTGEQRYLCHMYLKNLFETDFPRISGYSDTQVFSKTTNPFLVPDKSFMLFDRFQIYGTILYLIENASTKQDKVYLYSFADFQNDFMSSLYKQLLPDSRIDIKHIVQLNKIQDYKNDKGNINNLNILSQMISLLMYSCSNLPDMHYYYSVYDEFKQQASVFPYYIILNDYVVFLSLDYNTAFFCPDEPMHSYYLQMYNTALRQSNTLTENISSYIQLLEYLTQNETISQQNNVTCLLASPPIELILTPKLIDKYMVDCIEKTHIKNLFLHRIKQIKNEFSHTTLITMSGLNTFIGEGRCANYPPNLAKQIDVADRKSILENLIANNNTNYKLLLIDDTKFPIRMPLSMTPLSPHSILFVLYVSPNVIRSVKITEQTFYNSICDFLQYTASEFAYSVEETNNIIREAIKNIEC